jgi:CDP-diacylglycerol---serine O-phosphatidyltransferase
MKKYIPNTITLANLFLGCAATVSILEGRFMPAFWFLVAAGVADYADGMVARALNVRSPLGKELDSLADLVSFGVAPGAILYMLLVLGPVDAPVAGGANYAALPAFVLTVFSGLRLAKFNLDERQTEGFIGLATPSSALFVTGLMLVYAFDTYGLSEWVARPAFLYAVVIGLSALLVSEIPMFSLKISKAGWRGNGVRLIFVAVSLSMLVLLRELALSLIVVFYVVLNAGLYLFKKNNA